MKSILIGIDGSVRGEKALQWAASRAEQDGAALALTTVVDARLIEQAGIDPHDALDAVSKTLEETAASVRREHPGLSVSADVLSGGVVDRLVDAADIHDAVVLGTHHGSKLGEAVGGAKGLRVSVNSHVPTIVVPVDWSVEDCGSGIVVGVGPDNSSDAAIAFGVREALSSGMPLHLVSAWGLPSFLTKPAEMMGGGLAPVGRQLQERLDECAAAIKARHPELEVTAEAVEGPSPTKVLLSCCEGRSLLVMGTRSPGMLGRALFGSVSHSVLQNIVIPTAVVPQA